MPHTHRAVELVEHLNDKLKIESIYIFSHQTLVQLDNKTEFTDISPLGYSEISVF